MNEIIWKQTLYLDIALAQKKRGKQSKCLDIWFRFRNSNQKLPVKTVTIDINVMFTDWYDSHEIKEHYSSRVMKTRNLSVEGKESWCLRLSTLSAIFEYIVYKMR
jgi:hypothetical protein